MKNKKGFTLLELLVVVLIIGILSAIALPQYKKAVLKSKYAAVKQNAKTIASAMQRYYLVNNTYPANMNVLDIDVSDNKYYLSGGCVEAFVIAYGDTDFIAYWTCRSGTTLCLFSSPNQSRFNTWDEFCKKETQAYGGGKRACNSTTNCYYHYNIK